MYTCWPKFNVLNLSFPFLWQCSWKAIGPLLMICKMSDDLFKTIRHCVWFSEKHLVKIYTKLSDDFLKMSDDLLKIIKQIIWWYKKLFRGHCCGHLPFMHFPCFPILSHSLQVGKQFTRLYIHCIPVLQRKHNTGPWETSMRFYTISNVQANVRDWWIKNLLWNRP